MRCGPRQTARVGRKRMRPWTARYAFQAVVHNGLLYVLGGNDGSNKNDVWSSADGANWRFEGNADWGVREYHQAVSHQGRLYILGGSGGYDRNDVWSSLDGKELAAREGEITMIFGVGGTTFKRCRAMVCCMCWVGGIVAVMRTKRCGHRRTARVGRKYRMRIGRQEMVIRQWCCRRLWFCREAAKRLL